MITPALHAIAPAMVDLVEIADVDINAALLRGTIDLAVGERLATERDIVVELAGSVARAVCHARRRTGRPDTFAAFPDDGWPPELPRTIALRASGADAVIDACSAGDHLAVLPVVVAAREKLAIDRTPPIEPSRLYLAYRRPLGPSSLEPAIAAVRTAARALLEA